MEIQDFGILEERLPEAIKALDKLVAKAKRYGCPDVHYKVCNRWTDVIRHTDPDGRVWKEEVPMVWVEVAGEAPVVGDYRFLAHIELTEEGNLVDTVPGVKNLDTRFHHSTGFCEHCQTSRRRKDVYIVENQETGEQVQIGRTCLRDFLGMDSPNKIAHRFTLWKTVAEFSERWARPEWAFSLPYVLELTSAAVRLWGWCPRSQSDELEGVFATEHYVSLGLSYHTAFMSKEQKQIRQRLLDELRDSDKEKAQTVIDWVRASTSESDYFHNLRVLFAGNLLTDPRRVAIVCSAVGSYQREQTKTSGQAQEKTSEHQGEVKQRLRGLEVELATTIFLGSSQFGDRYLVKFRDAQGNVYTWFTGAPPQEDDGAALVIDGTVKDHDEFKGVKQTILTRVKVN